MNDEKELYLKVDPDKLLFNNNGDSVFIQNNEQYLNYLSDNLGRDFADLLVENRISCKDIIEELLESVYGSTNDVEYIQKYKVSPIAELKILRKAFETLTLCKSVLETLLDD